MSANKREAFGGILSERSRQIASYIIESFQENSAFKDYMVDGEYTKTEYATLLSELSEPKTHRKNLHFVVKELSPDMPKSKNHGIASVSSNSLEICFDGFSTYDVFGGPVAIFEKWEDSLRLLVWPNINEQNPQVIILDQAKEPSSGKEEN